MDSLQGKLVSGNFKGKEFDELTKKTGVLNTVTETLNTTFKTTTAEQSAYKEAAKQVGSTFGTNSEVFKNFSKAVGDGANKLKETDKAFESVSGTGKKASGVFQTIFSGLRNIANLIPGLGLSGVVLLLLNPLQALASSIIDYFTQLDIAKEKTKTLNEVNIASIDIFNKEKTQVEELASVAKDNNISLNARKEAISQLISKSPEYLKTLTLENINTAEGTKLIDAYVVSLQKKADIQAAVSVNTDATKVVADLKAEKQALSDLSKSGKVYYDDLSEAQQKFIDAKSFLGFRATASIVNARLDSSEITRVANNIDEAIKKAEVKVTASGQIFKDKFKAAFTDPSVPKGIIEKLRDQIKVLTDAQPTLLTDAEIKTNIAQVKKLTDQLNLLLGNSLKPHADRLNVEEQNFLKVIDSTIKTELAAENERYNEIEKTHTASYDEETTHLRKIEKINIDSLSAKIILLSKQKTLNAEELATLAEFKEKRSTIELETSQKVQEIEKKRFADQDKNLQATFAESISKAKDAQKAVLDDPDTSNMDRARANLQFIDNEIDEYKRYYQQLLLLNDNYNDEALQKARTHIQDLQRERSGGQKDEVAATEKDIQRSGDEDITEINIEYGRMRNAILSNEKLTSDERQKLVENLNNANNVTVLSKELETLNDQLRHKALLYAQNQITDAEYEKARLAAINKAAELETALRIKVSTVQITDVSSFVQNKIRSLFKIDVNKGDSEAAINQKIAQQQLLAQTISESFSLAKSAMDDFYNAEAAGIERSRSINEKKLQLELDQSKAHAQSQAEKDNLDKQFAAKKDKNDRDAFEKNKKVQKQQALINLALQLSNIAVVSSAPGPANLLTVGIFGQVMYALQTGIALAAYALNVGRINSAQFAYGGNLLDRIFAYGGNLMSKVFAFGGNLMGRTFGFGGNLSGGNFAFGGQPDMTTIRGGKIKGRSHSQGGNPFIFKGRVYEDEVDELSIIRTRNASRNKKYQLAGTHQQIASALNQLGGGVSFAPGAKVNRLEFGGNLASTLTAPMFIPSSNNSLIKNPNDKELLEEVRNLRQDQQRSASEISNWKDRFQVVQVTSSVTQAQKKEVRQKNIGTL